VRTSQTQPSRESSKKPVSSYQERTRRVRCHTYLRGKIWRCSPGRPAAPDPRICLHFAFCPPTGHCCRNSTASGYSRGGALHASARTSAILGSIRPAAAGVIERLGCRARLFCPGLRVWIRAGRGRLPITTLGRWHAQKLRHIAIAAEDPRRWPILQEAFDSEVGRPNGVLRRVFLSDAPSQAILKSRPSARQGPRLAGIHHFGVLVERRRRSSRRSSRALRGYYGDRNQQSRTPGISKRNSMAGTRLSILRSMLGRCRALPARRSGTAEYAGFD